MDLVRLVNPFLNSCAKNAATALPRCFDEDIIKDCVFISAGISIVAISRPGFAGHTTQCIRLTGYLFGLLQTNQIHSCYRGESSHEAYLHEVYDTDPTSENQIEERTPAICCSLVFLTLAVDSSGWYHCPHEFQDSSHVVGSIDEEPP
jgi:hypothetical protein